MGRSYTIKAPAKINLGLNIGNRRADGFHELSTVFQTISLCDELTLTFSSAHEQDELTIDGPVSLDVADGNLILETLRSARQQWNDLPFAHVSLEKRIPVGAGLGGGSSDAAAVLHVINKQIDTDIEKDLLRQTAVEIGADVPFFLMGGTARGEGKGEQLTPMSDLEAHVLVAVPPIEVDTEWAFQAYEKVPTGEPVGTNNHLSNNQFNNKIKSSHNIQTAQGWQSLDLSNDFEELIVDRFDVYERLRARMKKVSSHVSLSGSGSAMYSLFDDAKEANEALNRLRDDFSNVRFFHEQFVPSHQIPMFQ